MVPDTTKKSMELKSEDVGMKSSNYPNDYKSLTLLAKIFLQLE